MIKKSEKTEKMLQTLRENFTDSDYQEYILGNLKMKDVYTKYECNQNAMDYFFAERGYIKRGNLRNSKIKKDIFNPVNTLEAAYILGFYIADGCINGNKFVITLSEKDKEITSYHEVGHALLAKLLENCDELQKVTIIPRGFAAGLTWTAPDKEILEKIRDYMSPVTKLCYKPERVNKAGITTHPMYSFSFACKEIVSRLEELGLGQKKTYLEKSIKNIVPKEFMWDFIRGYWDGDGNINSSEVTKKVMLKNGEEATYQYNNIGFTIISKDPLILEEINDFFLESGISTHVYPDNKGNYLVGTHSKSEVEKLYNRLYTSSNLYLNRKRIKFDGIMKIPR